MSEINEGVRILVERMKTNPEEFQDGVLSRWAEVVRMASNAKWLTDEEHKLLDDTANQVQRDAFTGRVLKVLTQGEPDPYASEAESRKLLITPSQRALMGGVLTTTAGSNGTTWANSAITSSNTAIGGQYATKNDIQDALANYAKAVSVREGG